MSKEKYIETHIIVLQERISELEKYLKLIKKEIKNIDNINKSKNKY